MSLLDRRLYRIKENEDTQNFWRTFFGILKDNKMAGKINGYIHAFITVVDKIIKIWDIDY